MTPSTASAYGAVLARQELALIAPPAYDGARGFFSIEHDRLVAYDLVSGRRLWTIAALHPVNALVLTYAALTLAKRSNAYWNEAVAEPRSTMAAAPGTA